MTLNDKIIRSKQSLRTTAQKDIKSKPLLINPPPYLIHLLLQQKLNIERLTKDKRSSWRA